MKGKKVKEIKADKPKPNDDYVPLEVVLGSSAGSSTTSTRRNRAATIERTDKFVNIEDGLVPFRYSTSADYGTNMDVRDAVVLCQKAYYNFSIFRNTIDLMTEFSTSKIFFKNGSKKSRDFFKALFSKINIRGLQDRFFREYYRSGNVFVYRFDGEVQDEDLKQLTQTFGINIIKASVVNIPVRYVILNPADIQTGAISFANATYFKVLSDYELERLRKPRTEEDQEILDSLDPEIRKMVKDKRSGIVLLPLDKDLIVSIFYKKQDYEPFSIPMGYPVLADINFKAEMKKMDMALMRTLNQCILLVTMGAEPEKGGVNQKHIEAMQAFFMNESVARTLIADYTTKAEFITPNIADLLDPRKYEIVDKDIKEGLNNLLVNSEDKFANASVKIEVFVERLRQAREAFLDEFIIPEIKRIAKEIGLKNYPSPYFEEIDLKDNLEYAKIYTRLGELGILTPSETLESIDNGRLPMPEESIENQQAFREQKNKGLYEPIVGGPFSQQKMQNDSFKSQQKLQDSSLEHQDKQNTKDLAHQDKQKTKELQHISENPTIYKQPPVTPPSVGQPKGRPSGTSGPKKAGRIGASVEFSEGYSLMKLKDNIILSSSLHDNVKDEIKKKYKVKELNEAQEEIANLTAEIIISNESPEAWQSKIKEYIDNPLDRNEEAVAEIQEIAANHQVNEFLATLLYHSKIE